MDLKNNNFKNGGEIAAALYIFKLMTDFFQKSSFFIPKMAAFSTREYKMSIVYLW